MSKPNKSVTMVSFNPDKDIPDLEGKVVLVTGGNIGLGRESVYQLAKHNPQIFLAARDKAKADATIADIKKELPNAKITFLELDLASFASVKKAADTFEASSKRLDILMNNAGIMACPAGLTKEGYEIQFGTNHMGHALLSKLLLPTLQRTAKEPGSDVRIINLSSWGNNFAPKGGLIFDAMKTDMQSYTTFSRYGQSKLANILFNRELAKRYPSIKCVSVHPGSVQTNLISGPSASWPLLAIPLRWMGNWVTVSVQTGALGQLWASTSKDAKTGTFYHPLGKENKGSQYAQSEELQTELWDWTEKELVAHGY